MCLSTNELKTIVCSYILFVVKIDHYCCSALIFSLDILFLLSNSLFVQYSRIMLLFISICYNIYIIRIVVFFTISDSIDECRPNDRKCRRDSAKMTKKKFHLNKQYSLVDISIYICVYVSKLPRVPCQN